MENAVGREIPDEILQRYGKEGYKGAYARDGVTISQNSPQGEGICGSKTEQAGAFHPGSIIKNAVSGTAWCCHFIIIFVTVIM